MVTVLRNAHGADENEGTGLQSLPLHNPGITVAHLDASIRWYQRVLGFVCEARADIAEGEVAVLGGAGVRIERLMASHMAERPVRLEQLFAEPPAHLLVIGNKFVVFEVDDLARASAELEHLSVTILWRDKELAPGFVATAIRDLDGNLINIFQAH